ncbi:Histidine kinase-, DNA gyrase B-, and HSP90-like ATPase [Pseudonocardia thermophila]|uniref:histidine kinase n=1 Tax=Pseudonocardia thermophila TaxID=1848 RepID=A0A1M6P772_PSETH|nr:histidine kinase [Pseudonocardia thermophila]SHK03778.1 Histidine kinase-, DNA gyrase B-, and HSP90-like ATPase [Pseudonocardia thermophila]
MTRTARRTLLLAGVVVAAAIGSVALAAAPLGAGPPWTVVLPLCALPIVLAVAAGYSVPACRASTTILVAAADFAGIALAVDIGLLLVLLLFGRIPTGVQIDLVNAALVGLLFVATIAGPLGRRAARSARALVAGVRRTPDELLADFGDRSADGIPAAELLRQLAESLRRDLNASVVRLWWTDDEAAGVLDQQVVVPATAPRSVDRLDDTDLRVLSRAGVAGNGWLRAWLPKMLPDVPQPQAPQLRIAPAVYGGRVLGLIEVERAADTGAFSAVEERALGEVARRLGIVLRNRALDAALKATLEDLRRSNAALQASRTRLVTTADAERRRIERDLHDGAQQHLVALAVGLKLLRDSTEGTPGADTELLDELDEGVREAIAALRDLAHGIYPPLLRDAGVVEALRAAAKRTPLDVTVTAGELGDLSEPVRAAVYFCCVEALQNAAKHAPGSTVTIQLELEPGPRLTFCVADDGPGFDAAGRTGHGLQNMSDRVGALGGELEIRSAPGRGTSVIGTVPLSTPAPVTR